MTDTRNLSRDLHAFRDNYGSDTHLTLRAYDGLVRNLGPRFPAFLDHCRTEDPAFHGNLTHLTDLLTAPTGRQKLKQRIVEERIVAMIGSDSDEPRPQKARVTRIHLAPSKKIVAFGLAAVALSGCVAPVSPQLPSQPTEDSVPEQPLSVEPYMLTLPGDQIMVGMTTFGGDQNLVYLDGPQRLVAYNNATGKNVELVKLDTGSLKEVDLAGGRLVYRTVRPADALGLTQTERIIYHNLHNGQKTQVNSTEPLGLSVQEKFKVLALAPAGSSERPSDAVFLGARELDGSWTLHQRQIGGNDAIIAKNADLENMKVADAATDVVGYSDGNEVTLFQKNMAGGYERHSMLGSYITFSGGIMGVIDTEGVKVAQFGKEDFRLYPGTAGATEVNMLGYGFVFTRDGDLFWSRDDNTLPIKIFNGKVADLWFDELESGVLSTGLTLSSPTTNGKDIGQIQWRGK